MAAAGWTRYETSSEGSLLLFATVDSVRRAFPHSTVHHRSQKPFKQKESFEFGLSDGP